MVEELIKSMLVNIVLSCNVHCATFTDALTQAGEAARRRRSQSRSRRSSHSTGNPNITSCYESEDQVIDTQCKIIYLCCYDM